jgi:hypothetical protein
MLRTTNSRIYKNTEIFQQISDNQAALINGGIDIPISDIDELLPAVSNLTLIDLLNTALAGVPNNFSSLVASPSV